MLDLKFLSNIIYFYKSNLQLNVFQNLVSINISLYVEIYLPTSIAVIGAFLNLEITFGVK